VTGELESRHTTAAPPFRLSPWTYDSASPALASEGGILRLMPAACGRGFLRPRVTELKLRPNCNLSGNDANRQLVGWEQCVNKKIKRLEKMRNNPRGDWSIDDIRVVCEACNLRCDPPSTGSHWTISDASMKDILTIPAQRPIKAPYIRKLLNFLDAVQENRNNERSRI
jgi:hypothetical protein